MIGALTIATLFMSAALSGVPTFDAPIEINFPNDHYPTQPATADFNRDGQLDLVVPGRDVDGLVMIVSRNSSGGFEVSRTIDVGVQTDWAEACDLDGDGLTDIALAARATFGRIIILRGHGDGTFDPPIFLATERETRCVRAFDWNNDGRLDLVAVNYGSHSMQLFRNESTPGQLAFTQEHQAYCNRWTVGKAYPSWAVPADINHDGFLDLIDFTTGSSRMDARLCNDLTLGRERSWTSPILNQSAAGITYGTVADLDRDGNPDVIAHAIFTNRTNPIGVWRGDGVGGFAQPQLFSGATTGTAWNVSAADMDNDGDDDLIALSVLPGQVSIIENLGGTTGTLNLAKPVEILEADFPRHVCVFDFDNDGKLDLAIVDLMAQKMYVLRNNGVLAAAPTKQRGHEALESEDVNFDLNSVDESQISSMQSEQEENASAELAIALANMGPALPSGFAPAAVDYNPPKRSSLIATCGPPAEDCNVPHTSPFCFTTPCCETICAIRPDCCIVAWDADCVLFASLECRDLLCPSRGSCTEPHATPGCEDAACCENVTRLDPACKYNWDSLCVELVTYACVGPAPQVIAPSNAIDENEICYEYLNNGCGRRSDPIHMPVLMDQIRKGHIGAEGVRDVDAMLLSLSERKLVSLQLHADFPAQLVLSTGACDGVLVTWAESTAPAGGICAIRLVLNPGEWRITVGMATPMQVLRNGQPCLVENPDYPWEDEIPVPGFFTGDWWLSIDGEQAPAIGDWNGDSKVDSSDLGALLLHFGELDSEYDATGDGKVDSSDLGALLGNFNN